MKSSTSTISEQLNVEVARNLRLTILPSIPGVVLIAWWLRGLLPMSALFTAVSLVCVGALCIFFGAGRYLASGRSGISVLWLGALVNGSGWGSLALFGLPHRNTTDLTVMKVLLVTVTVLSASLAANAASKVGLALFGVPLLLSLWFGLLLRGEQELLLGSTLVYLVVLLGSYRISNNTTRTAMQERMRADELAKKLREALRESEHDSLHDPLTGAGNRRLLAHRYSDTTPGPVSIVCFDLDRFKQVNDTHGHALGDELLIAVAQRVENLLRVGDQLIRLGGDEFMVIAFADQAGAKVIADRVLNEVRAPYKLSLGEVTIGTSVGVATTTPGEPLEDAQLRADQALINAKDNGRGCVVVADQAVALSVQA